MTTVARRLATLLLALTTAACALTNTGDPSVAAIVGDMRITTAEIDRYFDDIRPPGTQRGITTQDLVNLQATLLNVRVRSEFLERAAERADVQVTQADVDAFIDEQPGGREQFEQQMTQGSEIVRELTLQLVRGQAIERELRAQLGERDLLALVREQSADVEVNPRYGTWSANDLQVQPVDPLAVPGQPAPTNAAP